MYYKNYNQHKYASFCFGVKLKIMISFSLFFLSTMLCKFGNNMFHLHKRLYNVQFLQHIIKFGMEKKLAFANQAFDHEEQST